MLSTFRTWPKTTAHLQDTSRRLAGHLNSLDGIVPRRKLATCNGLTPNFNSSFIIHRAHRQILASNTTRFASNRTLKNRKWTFRRQYSDSRRPDLGNGKEDLFRLLMRQDPRVLLAGAVSFAGGLFYVTHLERVPETGRWRFIAVSDKWETKLAKEQHKAFLDEFGSQLLPANHPATQMVASTVNAVLQANKLGSITNIVSPTLSRKTKLGDEDIWDPDIQNFEEASIKGDVASLSLDGRDEGREWNLFVVDDINIVNAAASFNNIIVWKGIFLVAGNADTLASVISHEIAHSVARHNSEKMSFGFIASGLLLVLSALGIETGFNEALVNLFLELPNSRTMELEADKIGLRLAAKACFDPKGAVDMQTMLMNFEKLKGALPKMDLSFLQTHPSGQLRIKRIREELPAAYAIRAGSSACAGVQRDFEAFQERAAAIDELVDTAIATSN